MRLPSARLAMALGILAWSHGAFEAAAAPIAPPEKSKPVSVADKLRRELDQIVTLEITEQPLTLAVNQIREQTKLNIVLDKFTLQQMGIDPDMLPINAKLKDVKLRSALRTVFGPYNLSFAIIGDTVLISTDEVTIYRQMRQRVSVDIEGQELITAIRQLARETATNLVIDPRVLKEAQGKVTLQAEDVPLETAVRLMSEMVGLKPVKVGNTLFICSKMVARDLKEDEPGEKRDEMAQRRELIERLVVPTPLPGVVPVAPVAPPGFAPAPPAEAKEPPMKIIEKPVPQKDPE